MNLVPAPPPMQVPRPPTPVPAPHQTPAALTVPPAPPPFPVRQPPKEATADVCPGTSRSVRGSSRGRPAIAAVLLVALAWALGIVGLSAVTVSPAERVTDEVQSRLDQIPTAPDEAPIPTADPMAPRPSPTPAEVCTDVVIIDEYGFEVLIDSCTAD